MTIEYKPIGVIRTPYHNRSETPKAGRDAPDTVCEIIFDEEMEEGLRDVKPGERYALIFCFDRSEGYKLTVPVRGVGPMKSLFATRVPHRPNPIGLSEITIVGVDKNVVRFTGADMFDGTPVLDMKPVQSPDYVPDDSQTQQS